MARPSPFSRFSVLKILASAFDDATLALGATLLDGAGALIGVPLNPLSVTVAGPPPPGSDEIQGEVADGAPAGPLKPVMVSGVDAGGINRSVLVNALRQLVIEGIDVPLSTLATEATLAAFSAGVSAALDVALSTRASEATLVTLATEATLAALSAALGAALDVPLSTRASEATLATRAAAAQLPAALVGGRLVVDGSGVVQPVSAAALPLPAGAATEATLATRASEASLLTRATEATLAAVLARLDVALSTRAAEATLATRASEATLATRAAAAQLPAALVGGRLDENLGAWLGSTAPTVGAKVTASSIPVALPTDMAALPVTGTVTANVPAATLSAKASALNALASAAIPAAGVGLFTYLHSIVVGFDSVSATDRLVQVKEGATVLMEFYIGKATNPFQLPLIDTWKQPTANTAMTVELAAGGVGNTGKVNVTYHQGA